MPVNKGHPLPPDRHTLHPPYLRCHRTSPRDRQVEYHPRHRTRRDRLHPHQNQDSRPRRRSHRNRNPHQLRFNKVVPKSLRLHQKSAVSQATMNPTGDRLRTRSPREPDLRVMRQPLRFRHKHHRNLCRRRGVRYLRRPSTLRSRILLSRVLRSRVLPITPHSIKAPRHLAFPLARNSLSRLQTPVTWRTSHSPSNTAHLLHKPGNKRHHPSNPNRNRNHPLRPT